MTDSPASGAGAGERRVYRSIPGTPSLDSVLAEVDKLSGRVYVGLRDGSLSPEATFDLACALLDWGPASPTVRELAEQSVAETDPARLAEIAGQVLAETEFRPGFNAEPRLLTELEDALEAVVADMRATGVAGPVRLAFLDDSDHYLRNVFAEFRGSFSFTSGISPSEAQDRISALLAVADDVQDAIMGALMIAWPVCPDHHLGGHPREHDSQAVWWCNGDGTGHAIAPIGHWAG